MSLDIRLPIGLMFSLFGLILIIFGMFSDAEGYQRSLNINVNLWWGVVMAVFGGVMLFLAWRGKQTQAERGTNPNVGENKRP
jgi:hypothetical protein